MSTGKGKIIPSAKMGNNSISLYDVIKKNPDSILDPGAEPQARRKERGAELQKCRLPKNAFLMYNNK
jgi:hypothetical protein